jgi:hypothetical protein
VSGRVSQRLASGLGTSVRRNRPAIKESGQTNLAWLTWAAFHIWVDSDLLCELHGDKHCVECRN